jgi:hypothetical protein
MRIWWKASKRDIAHRAADFFDTGLQKLIHEYGKCLSSGGDYVE